MKYNKYETFRETKVVPELKRKCWKTKQKKKLENVDTICLRHHWLDDGKTLLSNQWCPIVPTFSDFFLCFVFQHSPTIFGIFYSLYTQKRVKWFIVLQASGSECTRNNDRKMYLKQNVLLFSLSIIYMITNIIQIHFLSSFNSHHYSVLIFTLLKVRIWSLSAD